MIASASSRLAISMIMLSSCLTSGTAFAEQSFWGKVSDNLTPNTQTEQAPPDETLQAPFPTDASPVANPANPLMGIYKGQTVAANRDDADLRDLSVAHRSEEQVKDWISEAVALALSFDTQSLKSFGTVLRPYFGAEGLKEFKTYLTDLGIPSYLATSRKSLNTYVERPPLITLQRASDKGLYTWVLDVPVLMSYRDVVQPKAKPMVRKQSIRVVVRRTDQTALYKEGMMITGWSARPAQNMGDIARFR